MQIHTQLTNLFIKPTKFNKNEHKMLLKKIYI